MDTIAITKDGRKRIILCGDIYIRQTKVMFGDFWMDNEETKQEWIASKWILDNGMQVASEYPTIDEIRKEQSK